MRKTVTVYGVTFSLPMLQPRQLVADARPVGVLGAHFRTCCSRRVPRS
jgi:hypothetical protein